VANDPKGTFDAVSSMDLRNFAGGVLRIAADGGPHDDKKDRD
jgi:hypothetical protein